MPSLYKYGTSQMSQNDSETLFPSFTIKFDLGNENRISKFLC
jgi:hypothetical protein